jgi:hypothetical protein
VTITTWDLFSLNECFALACHRCGKPEPDMFEREADAELLLRPHAMPPGVAVRVPHLFTLASVRQADLEALRPAHRACLPRPDPPPRHDGDGAYDILRSVS